MTDLQPQEQQPEPAAPPSQSQIAVTAKYHWLTFTFAMFKVKLFINGYEVPARWGRNVIPMPPGQHTVQVYVPYLLPPRIGPAETTVTTTADEVVELEYRAPLWQFSRGSLGPPPQKHNGAGIQIAILIAVVLIICLCCGAAVFAEA